jgi:simple sugar transport system substrate-binding protein
VTPDTKAEIEKAKAAIAAKDGSPFKGPVMGQDGKVVFADGTVPDYAAIEDLKVFVDGVVGKLPT